MALKPICVKCQRFYRPKKNGYCFVEGMPKVADAHPGTEFPERWQPYKLWRGDLWKCEGCGHELISGVAHAPMNEHYRPDFASDVAKWGATLQINDC